MEKLEIIKSKIYSCEVLVKVVAKWKFLGKKIVFTNGCFDLLHLGHIDYLSKAADMGDILVVGLNSNSSVKKLGKGETRPIQDEHSRAVILAALHLIDAITLFDEETPYELIKLVKPDVLVKGADWKVEAIAGYDIVKANGGIVTTIDYLPGYSTTAIENKIKNT